MNKQQLIQYVLRKLGHPVIHIEIAQEQIEDCINDALDLFREYHSDALKLKFKEIDLVAGTKEYTMDSDVFSIVDIFGERNLKLFNDSEDEGYLLKSAYVGNTGLFDSEFNAVDMEVIRQRYSLYRSTINRDYLFDYSYLEKKLIFLVDIDTAETVSVLCNCYLDSSDANYSSLWLRNYVTALCGLAWAQNIGKYQVTLPGNVTMNYNDIFNKYDALRQELEENIIERYSSTLDIFIG